MAGKVRVEGIADLDKALAELGRRTGLATIYRALEKVGRPIRDDMRDGAPDESGSLKDSVKMIRASAERCRRSAIPGASHRIAPPSLNSTGANRRAIGLDHIL